MIPEMLAALVVVAAFFVLVVFGPEVVSTPRELPPEFAGCQEIGLPIERDHVVDATPLPTCEGQLAHLRACGEVGGHIYRCEHGHAWRFARRRWLGYQWEDLERWSSEDETAVVRSPAPWEVRT